MTDNQNIKFKTATSLVAKWESSTKMGKRKVKK